MRDDKPGNEAELRELDARWHVVYVAVIVFTVAVIAALWFFSHQFSS